MTTTKLLLLAFLIGGMFFLINSGCRKDPETTVAITPPLPPPPTITNILPVANAGPDQTIMKPRNNTLLSGDLSKDSDGSIASYNWTAVAGPNAPNMNNNLIANLKPYKKVVFNLEEGVYLFELMVTDKDGATARDTMKVTVLPDSLTRGDPSRMKRFDKLQWGNLCDISINNISSVVPVSAGTQVFIRSYDLYSSSGWIQLQPVLSSGFWYEIINNVLIIHADANILCDWDDSFYDVLVKWN